MDEEDVGEYRDFYNVGFSSLLEFVGQIIKKVERFKDDKSFQILDVLNIVGSGFFFFPNIFYNLALIGFRFIVNILYFYYEKNYNI